MWPAGHLHGQLLNCTAVCGTFLNISVSPGGTLLHAAFEALDACRATFKADPELRGTNGHLPDTFLSTPGWHKGVAFINGFNLGWYWPAVGPQMTMYVPGPLLKGGENELILLEVDGAPEDVTGQGAEFAACKVHCACLPSMWHVKDATGSLAQGWLAICLLLIEHMLDHAPWTAAVSLTGQPDFYGPAGQGQLPGTAADSEQRPNRINAIDSHLSHATR